MYFKNQSTSGSLLRQADASAILQVCRLCYDEARGLFYATLNFALSRCWGLVSLSSTSIVSRSPFTFNASTLLTKLTFVLGNFRLMPTINQLRQQFPRLKSCKIRFPDDISGQIPLGAIEDVSEILKNTHVHPGEEVNSLLQVEGSFLRWIKCFHQPTFSEHFGPLLQTMWEWSEARRLERALDGEHIDDFEWLLDLNVEYRHCVLYFRSPPLYELPSGTVHFDETADFHDESKPRLPGRWACQDHSIFDCNDAACTPESNTHPAWNIKCTFDVRNCVWRIELLGRVWLCAEHPDPKCLSKPRLCRHNIRHLKYSNPDLNRTSGQSGAATTKRDLPIILSQPVHRFDGRYDGHYGIWAVRQAIKNRDGTDVW